MSSKAQDRLRAGIPHFIALVVALVVLFTVPLAWCGRDADRWMQGRLEIQLALAGPVERQIDDGSLGRNKFQTGSAQFSGEWLFGTYLMAGFGFGHMALEHPELTEKHAALMARCIDAILRPEVRAFDAESWGEDPLAAIGGPNAHVAYLGYLNLLLGMHRQVSGATNYAALNDRISMSLARQLADSPWSMLETYPGEAYPVDNCFVIGSLGLHQTVSGTDHSAVIRRWVDTVRARYVDEKSGLLIQAVDPLSGQPIDAPRGSGTTLGLFALHYADAALAEALYGGVKKSLARRWLGFGAVREYPEGVAGSGDIDSGPIIFGYGFSATGFTIAGARRYGDEDYFRRLVASAHLCGAPMPRMDGSEFISGGPLGNAILFAMLTTPRLATSPGGERP